MLIRRSLRLVCSMADGGEGAGGGEQAEVIDQGQQTDTQQGQQSSGGNPAWEPLRSELDPISFSRIEPHLKKWETEAQKRVETANGQFAPYQQVIGDSDPDRVRQALSYSKMLDENPEQVYQALGQFLQANGRMPANQAEAAQALEDAQETDPQQFADPRVDQLQERLDAIQQAEQTRQAHQDLDSSIGALRKAHPDLEPQDVQEIVRRAAFVAQQNPGQNIDFNKSLEQARGEYAEIVNRIRSTPRQSDSAPQLPPLSGGAPTAAGQQPKSWGQVSRSDLQDFLAAQLTQNKG